MSSEWKLTVRLKQLTPMVHFQFKQDGATLRATEVKPKLDRFILQLAKRQQENGKIEVFKEIQDELKVIQNKEKNLFCVQEGEKKALHYKMQIMVRGVNRIDNVCKRNQNFGAYFFTDAKDKNYTLYDCVEIVIWCFIPCIYKVLKEVMPMFIAVHNFGFRQDKGYGHFEVTEMNSILDRDNHLKFNQERLINEYQKIYHDKYELYELEISEKNNANIGEAYKTILNMIHNFHQRLKSGLNYGGYVPSYLLKVYLKRNEVVKQYTNEKKYLKQKILSAAPNKLRFNVQHESVNENVPLDLTKTYYCRGVLGLAEQYTFTKLIWDDKKDIEYRVTINAMVKSNNGSSNAEKFRFASPLYYLPIRTSSNDSNMMKVIMIADYGILNELENQEISTSFVITKIEPQNGQLKKLLGNITFDEIPLLPIGKDEGKFDLIDFLNSYCKNHCENSLSFNRKKIDYLFKNTNERS